MPMNLNITAAKLYLLSLIAALIFVGIAIFFESHYVNLFDNAVISLIQGIESAGLTRIMSFFTYIGSGLPAVVIGLLLLFPLASVGYRRTLIFYIVVVSGSALLNMLLKLVFHRARPTLHQILTASGYSFPSGHAMGAFSLYGIVMILLWKRMPGPLARTVLLIAGSLMILAIGGSRIYLGVHYPSDVIAGYTASAALLAASVGLYRQFARNRRDGSNNEYKA
jgi:undecaprenyl-diphosphatase